MKLPRIKTVLPTNLPVVSANELRMDNLFLLEDNTYALVDYESEDSLKNRIKYANYIVRVMERHYREHGSLPIIRMIVIYTGDVRNAEHTLTVGCMTLTLEQVFVADLPAETIYQTVREKLALGAALTEQELMQLIILPLAERGREGKQRRVRQVIRFAKLLKNKEEQKFVLSGLLVSSDKFISKEDAESIRREISMTKVGQLLFEEGMEKGIEAFILDNLEEQISEERIIEKLQRRFQLCEEDAKAYFEKYALVVS